MFYKKSERKLDEAGEGHFNLKKVQRASEMNGTFSGNAVSFLSRRGSWQPRILGTKQSPKVVSVLTSSSSCMDLMV